MIPASIGRPLDVLVIGGGQAGLALGYHLAATGLRFQIVDAGDRVGHAWRARWDSLQLFTPAQYANLPGLPFPAPPDTYPGRTTSPTTSSCTRRSSSCRSVSGVSVTSLTNSRDGGTSRRPVPRRCPRGRSSSRPGRSRFRSCRRSREISTRRCQLHSADYQRPRDVPPGRVLVVGAANSGCQIAQELSATHSVELSIGQRIPTIPQRPLGRDVWWWASRARLDKVTADSKLGARLSGRDQRIGTSPRRLSRRHGVRIRPRVTAAAGRTVTFADGAASEFDTVIWATGYRTDHTWIDVPAAKDESGRIRHTRGVTSSPGLYLLGSPGNTPEVPPCSAGSARTPPSSRATDHGDRRRAERPQ